MQNEKLKKNTIDIYDFFSVGQYIYRTSLCVHRKLIKSEQFVYPVRKSESCFVYVFWDFLCVIFQWRLREQKYVFVTFTILKMMSVRAANALM